LNSVLTAALFAQSAVQAPGAPSSASTKSVAEICGGGATYEGLVGNWRKPSSRQDYLFGGHPIELTITSPEYEDRQSDAKEASSQGLCDWGTTWVGIQVSTDGEENSFADGGGEARGGTGKLLPESLARIESLIERLPEDGHRVPPPERRLLVTVHRNDQNLVRLYDTANLPDKIIELIRVTGVRISVRTPVLHPDTVWSAKQTETSGLWAAKHEECGGDICGLIVSPNKTIAVFHDGSNNTLEVVQGSTRPGSGYFSVSKVLRKIPETWQPANGGCDAGGNFSPDGGYFLVTLLCHEGVVLYDTREWELIADSRVFPQRLTEYLPFADWRLGIAVKKNRRTEVWDMQSHRKLFPLDGVGFVWGFALSPDGLRLAVYSEPSDEDERKRGEWHLDVWNLKDGKKLHEYWPVEWASSPHVDPVWWASGRWLAAPFYIDFSGGSGIGLWDVETGRYVGSLSLPERCDASKGLLADGEKLVVRCSVDKKEQVQEWSVEGVERQLRSAANSASTQGYTAR
jgi:hypothetical protein